MSEDIRKLFPKDMKYIDALPIANYIEQLQHEKKQLKEVIEKISNILNETTTFCESCASKDYCPEEDCVLYRIEKLVDKDSDK